MIDLRQLRYFVAVAEELNFSRAAERVFITQPALTHQIKRLEGELGVVLLTRTSRSVTLTPQGEKLLTLSREVLGRLEQGLADLRTDTLPKCLRIGFTDYVSYTPVAEKLKTFAAAHPSLELRHIEGSTLEQIAALQRGELDVGFFVSRQPHSQGVKTQTLWREPLMLAVPETHPLAALERVPLAALEGEPLILNSRESNPGMYSYLTGLFHDAGIQPNIVVNQAARMYSFAGVMRLIEEGVGMFLIVQALSRLGYEGIVFRPVIDPTPTMPFRMAWQDGVPKRLVEALKETFT